MSIAMPKSHIIRNVGDNLRLCLRSVMLITLNMMNWPEGDFGLLSQTMPIDIIGWPMKWLGSLLL